MTCSCFIAVVLQDSPMKGPGGRGRGERERWRMGGGGSCRGSLSVGNVEGSVNVRWPYKCSSEAQPFRPHSAEALLEASLP